MSSGSLRTVVSIATRRAGVGERQRLEQHAVDDAEDRGVGADAERQHDHDERAEAGGLEEESERLAEIGEHG